MPYDALRRSYPFTGHAINVQGLVMVYYFGRLIALIDNHGDMYWRDDYYPLFLVEYIIQQPDPLKIQWN